MGSQNSCRSAGSARKNSSRRPRGAGGRPGQAPGIQRWEPIALSRVERVARDTTIKIINVRMYLFVPIPGVPRASRIIVRSRLQLLISLLPSGFPRCILRGPHESGFSLVGLIEGTRTSTPLGFCLSERVRQIRSTSYPSSLLPYGYGR